MVDVYIDKRKTGYVVIAKKRSNLSSKRSCYDETVFSFFRKEVFLPDLLRCTYEGLLKYIDEGLLDKEKEEIHIRTLHREVFDAFSKGRKSLGKMKFYLKNDESSYKSWKIAFEEKNNLIKRLMSKKSRINVIHDTLEDRITQNVIEEINNINPHTLLNKANIKEQRNINEGLKSTLRDCLLKEPLTRIENYSILESEIASIVIYSDGGISIKGEVETGHSYGFIIKAVSQSGDNYDLIKVKGRLEPLKYLKEKHNVDFMELYAIYRSLKILESKIVNNEIRVNLKVLVKTDNKSNVDVFDGIRESKHLGNTLLWDEIKSLGSCMKIDIEWVKGHDKDINNNIADMLVQEGRLLIDEGEVRIIDMAS